MHDAFHSASVESFSSFHTSWWILLCCWLLRCSLLWHGFNRHWLLLIHHVFLWLLLLISTGIDVLSDNAKEVGEQSIDAACNVKRDDNFLFPCGLDESNTIVTSHNGVLLVKEHEVDGRPDSNEGDANDYQDAGSSHVSSAWVSILGEEYNGECWCNDEKWSKNDTNEDVPPVDIIIKELVEDFEENEKSEGKDNSSNEEDTALDWEEAAACQSLQVLLGALAEAAAAHKCAILQFFFDFIDFLVGHAHHFFLSRFHHHVVHFIGSGGVVGLFFSAFRHSWYIILLSIYN